MEKKLCTFFEGYSVVQVVRINSEYSVNIYDHNVLLSWQEWILEAGKEVREILQSKAQE